jgi:hypothetical protein
VGLTKVAAIALANKMARMAWEMMNRGLQGTRRTRGVKEITSGIRGDVTVGKGEQQVMQSR